MFFHGNPVERPTEAPPNITAVWYRGYSGALDLDPIVLGSVSFWAGRRKKKSKLDMKICYQFILLTCVHFCMCNIPLPGRHNPRV